MTFEQLTNIIKKHKIPKNVHLMSDSGWECDATEMDGVYYNKERNLIVFTQDNDGYDGDHIHIGNCIITIKGKWKRLSSKKR